MARPRKSPAQTELLTEAAEFLEAAGKPEHAAAVRDALTEVTRSKSREDADPTFTVYVRSSTWRNAQKAGAVPDLIEEGFAALLAGRFKPTRPARGGGQKGTFSARASHDRREQVTAYVTAHAKKLGWEPSPRQVAAAWLEHKYGAESGT
ncbi:hypothetical protein ABZ619_39280 [Streptomyces sp. NPDC007851]|uniref:hypothetical protein n=1 Tax=Streptomyces sp. NPDC007851 TaxID=3155008 RepID=UPI0033DEE341